jgi:hypothetical protein
VYSRHKTASTNDGLPEISKMKYRNRIPEPGTTISGLLDERKPYKYGYEIKEPIQTVKKIGIYIYSH